MTTKISTFQYSILGFMLGNALFLGYGIIILINITKQDTWLIPLLTPFLALIPLFCLIAIINYEPTKNIFLKTKKLCGVWGGTIINIILCLFFFLLLTLLLCSSILFCISQYLSNVPFLILGSFFIIIIIYGVSKGIETIARTNEILFYVAIFLITIISFALFPYLKPEHVKPILTRGINPILKSGLYALTYTFAPLLTLLVIPKAEIANPKKYYKSLSIGILSSILLLIIPFFYIISIMTIDLAELFRYPAYYVQYKIDLFGALSGLENFLSLHWLLNTITALFMCTYCLSSYLKTTFNLKTKRHIIINNIIICVLSLLLANLIIGDSLTSVHFMNNYFPLYIAPIPFLIILIMTVLILWSKKTRNN